MPALMILLLLASTSSQSPDTKSPIIYNSSTAYNYTGCFTETDHLPNTTGVRALNGGTNEVGLGNMTVETCLDFCGGDSPGGARYTYAGLEYSRECWCAQTFNTLSSKVHDGDCDLVCDGNASQYCGGSMRLSLYTLRSEAAGGVPWMALAWFVTALCTFLSVQG
ncbi:unnamed protein product [Discula destructiva]